MEREMGSGSAFVGIDYATGPDVAALWASIAGIRAAERTRATVEALLAVAADCEFDASEVGDSIEADSLASDLSCRHDCYADLADAIEREGYEPVKAWLEGRR